MHWVGEIGTREINNRYLQYNMVGIDRSSVSYFNGKGIYTMYMQ